MKHRSVIAFVIVAAALFAAPQLSHDLQSLRSAMGSRLRGELMHAFLSLHAEDGAAAPAATAGRPQKMLASCPKAKAGAAAGVKKDEPRAAAPRTGAPAVEAQRVQLAMMTEPEGVPEDWEARAALAREVEAEVAMIIPPDGGVDPRALADVHAARASAQEGAALRRQAAGEVRHLAFVAARFEGDRFERQGPDEESLRRLRETLPGPLGLRLDSEGTKAKVLKVIKRAGGAAPAPVAAPRAPRTPGQTACLLKAPAADAQQATVIGE